ncbi:MAG: TonB-dependent receptor [Colwellia sp.]|nr:TonB-dependent receptor [Colwellia sp.]
MKTHRLSRISGALVLALGLSTSVMANTTTSSIKGKIQGPQGNPAVGTVVTIVHTPSGTTKNAVVNAAGIFVAKGLRVGGPYEVKLDSNKFNDQTVKDVYLTLGETYPMNIALQQEQAMETIEVTGRAISSFSGGTGPASHFSAEDLASAPAINRDIKDIVRIDPRIYVDESREDAIQCGGGSPRFNSLTVDGVRMNDSFGLNDNGYPTTRIPFSYDSIDQVSVELAPFDVKYGGFTSCNINAVTKSGGNEVHGGFFYDYTNDSMKGDSVEGEDLDNGDYTEERYGFNVGLPLIEDTLFFFGSYEKLEGVELFGYAPLGDNISQGELDRIVQIASDVYGYDAGGTTPSMPVDDEKVLLKLDWNINDQHRASLVYNYNDGFKLDQSDTWAMTLDSHYYEKGAKLNSLVGSLYSDWNDNFSTEVRLGKTSLDNRQNSLDAASSFGEVSIRHGGTTVFLGPDDSRQSNEMNWEQVTFKLAGNYYFDEHTITAGYEYEELTAFNLFMQHTQGEFRFDSIDDFEAGQAARVYYNNSAGTNVPSDASQEFTYALHTFYVQDEFELSDLDMTIMYGLRYDKYTSDDSPRFNQNFKDRYGFGNDSTFDGISLLQPRLGINWSVEDNLEVRGGFGLYSGGNPNVWLSNSFSNDGLVQIGLQHRGVDLFNTPMTGDGRPVFETPQDMFDEIQNLPVGGGDGSVNAVDPDFELPSEWKYSLGATYTTDDDYIIAVDILHNRKQNSATIRDAGQRYASAVAPDGRPTYERVAGRTSEFILTNSNKDGQSTILSFAVSKDFDFGLNASFSYAYTQSEDANPMTSAVAGSNYSNLAATDALNPGMETSDYGVPHRFTMNLSYTTQIIEGLNTTFSLFGQVSEGQSYSYTFDNSDGAFGDSNWNRSRQLLYIPAENDANVVYDEGFDLAAFNSFVESEGLARGEITKRNDFNANWRATFDFKISQQIPGLMDGHKGSAFFIVQNLGNMLNDDWGVMKQGQFVGNRMVEMSINDAGQYVYEEFNAGNEEQTYYRDGSLWEVRVGVRYDF